ncbi:MAG: phosphoglycerate kinase [Rickettsiales bacterium]|jgi:phosphoglycerate kinase|nr:phosphoglycerate kinase [Rickettsiales bacterium]
MMLKAIGDMNGVRGKRVLVRADLNVPVEGGRISDDSRIRRFAPTAKRLSDMGAKVIVLTHYGRPKGRDMEFSTRMLAPALAKAIGRHVSFVPDAKGPEVEAAVADMGDGDIILLENVRFYPEEERNDPAFAAELAKLGDVYVNDAFSAAHRAHASTEGITRFLDSYAGLLMAEEVDALSAALENPARPAVAIVAGSKVSTKIALLGNIVARVDAMIIGGAMANTFLLARGHDIGASLAEPDMADTAGRILAKAAAAGCEILLPVDARVAKELRPGAVSRVVKLDGIAPDDMILDIGGETIGMFKAAIAKAKTVLMNGPLGAFEVPPFDVGTDAIVEHIADLTEAGKLMSIAGGGDTVSAINKAGRGGGFTYISTAGGAFLEWLEGKTLPAIVPLEKKDV